MKRHSTIIKIVIGLVLSLPGVQEAAAQQASSFEQLQILVEPDDEITVVDADGQEIEGRLIDLSPSSLRISVDGVTRQYSQAEVMEITREGGDPIGDGAKKGAYIGLAFGGVMGALYCTWDCRLFPAFVGFYTGFGAGVGAISDALIREGERTIYRAPVTSSSAGFNVAPIIGNDQNGVRVSFGF